MNIANFKLIFDRKKLASATKQGLIQIECYRKGGDRIWVSTGIKVFPNQWNEKKKLINEKHANAFDLNKTLKKMTDDFLEHETKQYQKGITVPLDFYKKFLASESGHTSFLEFYENEFKDNPSFTPNTKKNYRSGLNHLKTFKGIKYFSDLNYTNIEALNRYYVRQKLHPNTIVKYHKYIRRTINEAIRKGLVEKHANPYEDFKMKGKKTEKYCLSIDDIRKLEEVVIKDGNPGLARSRDMFLFSVYTGLRFSDLQQINEQTIKFKKDGIYLDLISQKTKKHKQENLALFFKNEAGLSKPEMIIAKYKDVLTIYPFRISLQPYNRNLKILAEMAHIDLKLTSHIARHTFITFMVGKVSIPVLQEMAQHADINTTRSYIHLSDKMKEAELKKVDWSY